MKLLNISKGNELINLIYVMRFMSGSFGLISLLIT